MSQVSSSEDRFGRFTLDLDTRQLTQADREILLAPKAFELLAALVVDRPKVPPTRRMTRGRR